MSRLVISETAIAASIEFGPPEKSMALNAESVAILSAAVPPSYAPGWSSGSPMVASLLLARTWLLLRM